MDTANIVKGIIENMGMDKDGGCWIQVKGLSYVGLTALTASNKPLVKGMYVQFAETNLQITKGTLLMYEPTPTERHCLLALAMAFRIIKPTMSNNDVRKKCASLYEVLLELITK